MSDTSSLVHTLEYLQSIWPVAVPLTVSTAAFLTPIVNGWNSRRNKSLDVSMTREQRLMSEADARIAQASKIDADVMTRLQAELVRVTARMADLEQERERAVSGKNTAEDRAQYWHRRAHDMRHVATQMTTIVTDAARKEGREMPATPDLSLPAFGAALPST